MAKTAMREAVFNKYSGKCSYCGCDITKKDFQVDHLIPKAFWESTIKNKFKVPIFLKHLTIDDVDHFDNLMPTCRVCNKWKSAHSLELFRTELQEQIKRLNDYSSNYRMAKKYNLISEQPKEIKFYFETYNQ